MNKSEILPATPENVSKAKKVFEHLKKMRDEIVKADRLALQVLAHPDATANQIMELHSLMVRSRHPYQNEVRRMEYMFQRCERPFARFEWDKLKL